MIFTIPVWEQRKTIEDMNPHLSEAERLRMYKQKNHVRLFGGDIIDLIKESFGVDCFIPVNTLFTKAEFLAAGIPWQPDKEPSGNSIFLYKKILNHRNYLSGL